MRRYPIQPGGTVGAGETFLDLTNVEGDAAIDGIKADALGNVYVCGPGGLWIVAADGAVLGRIGDRPEEPHNLAWGDADRRTLYLTAQTGVYRLRTLVPARDRQ